MCMYYISVINLFMYLLYNFECIDIFDVYLSYLLL